MSTPLDRFFEAAGCRTQVALADFLGIKQSSVADAKKRGSIPSDWLITLWRKKGVNPDWILTGQGARGLISIDSPEIRLTASHVKEIRPPEDCSIEELVTEIIYRISNRHGLASYSGVVPTRP